ncbi:hypothetical protein RDWZM_010011, partial [Blomia tropicalis]
MCHSGSLYSDYIAPSLSLTLSFFGRFLFNRPSGLRVSNIFIMQRVPTTCTHTQFATIMNGRESRQQTGANGGSNNNGSNDYDDDDETVNALNQSSTSISALNAGPFPFFSVPMCEESELSASNVECSTLLGDFTEMAKPTDRLIHIDNHLFFALVLCPLHLS